ncbi:MAG TPA: MASE1 domain-containing protein, partial [Opitutaceae bacterium]|nr:MASE1 domain-containing protein [Opitutaceae bacterium]
MDGIPKSHWSDVLIRVLKFILAYCILGYVGLKFSIMAGHASLVWPCAGLALHVWWRRKITLPWLIATVLLFCVLAGNRFPGIFLIAASMIGETLAAAAVLRALKFGQGQNRVYDILTLMSAALVGGSIAALGGVLGVILNHEFAWSGFVIAVFTRWAGDYFGMVLIFPILELWKDRDRFDSLRKDWIKITSLIALGLTISLTFVVGRNAFLENPIVVASVLYPLVVAAALMAGEAGAAVVCLIICFFAVEGIMRNSGGAGGRDRNELIVLQAIFDLALVSV